MKTSSGGLPHTGYILKYFMVSLHKNDAIPKYLDLTRSFNNFVDNINGIIINVYYSWKTGDDDDKLNQLHSLDFMAVANEYLMN